MNADEPSIRHADGSRDIELARGLIAEYARWLGEDLCFQGFEHELATLPGSYAPPRGRLLLAGHANDAFGCIALHPLDDATRDKIAKEIGDILWYCSMAARGLGLGLAEVAEMNVEKLKKRYPDGFTSERSLNRPDG